MENKNNNIGKIIKERRNEKEMSQRELAKRAGVTQVTICKIERGQERVTKRVLFSIASVLEIDLSELGYTNEDEFLGKEGLFIENPSLYWKYLTAKLSHIDAEIAYLEEKLQLAKLEKKYILDKMQRAKEDEGRDE